MLGVVQKQLKMLELHSPVTLQRMVQDLDSNVARAFDSLRDFLEEKMKSESK